MPTEIMVTGDLPSGAAAAPASALVRSAGTATLTPLVARIASGDQDALAQLYDSTAAKLLGFAMLIVKDQQDAEEVACDVYLQVWQAPLRYDPARGSVLAWLLGICRARAIDRCRRRRARAPGEVAAGEPDCGGVAADGDLVTSCRSSSRGVPSAARWSGFRRFVASCYRSHSSRA